MESIVYLNGNFVALGDAKVSILDRGFCYGDALFETMRAYSGKIFHLDLHLERLEQGAQNIFLKIPMSRKELEKILYQTLEKNECPNAVIRLTLTRGEGILGKLWQTDTTPNLSILVRSHSSSPVEWFSNGVPVSLIPNSASRFGNLEKQIKSANYLNHILARKQAEDLNSVDGIMINDRGQVCDGTSSNVFLVKEGIMSTPSINGYVLEGVTRKVVLTLAGLVGVMCQERVIHADEVLQSDEMFLTNTGWEILPVTRVDGKMIGSGQPGPVTEMLRREFRKSVDAEIGK